MSRLPTGPRTRPQTRPQPVARSSVRSSVLASRARFERRAMAARRRPVRLAAAVAAAVGLVALLVWVVGFSPLLVARTVTVTGLSDEGERTAVQTAAQVPLGQPLARVDTSGVAARVRAISTVRSVSVSRSWPSSITIAVERKVPVLAVKNPQGQLQVVDASGQAFQTVAALPAGVALVNATTAAPDPEGVRAAISVLGLLPPAQRAQVTNVTVSSADLVTFQLGPVSVVWGGVADGAKKLTVLLALLPTSPAVVDVSAPDTPVTR